MGWGTWVRDSPGSQAEGVGVVDSRLAEVGPVGSRLAEAEVVGSRPAEAGVVGSLVEGDGGGRDRHNVQLATTE